MSAAITPSPSDSVLVDLTLINALIVMELSVVDVMKLVHSTVGGETSSAEPRMLQGHGQKQRDMNAPLSVWWRARTGDGQLHRQTAHAHPDLNFLVVEALVTKAPQDEQAVVHDM